MPSGAAHNPGRRFAAVLSPGLTCCGRFGAKTDRAFWASRRDPAFFTPQRHMHRIAQGRASGEASKRRPGLIGARRATLYSVATFSSAAKWNQFGAKKTRLTDQFFNNSASSLARVLGSAVRWTADDASQPVADGAAEITLSPPWGTRCLRPRRRKRRDRLRQNVSVVDRLSAPKYMPNPLIRPDCR